MTEQQAYTIACKLVENSLVNLVGSDKLTNNIMKAIMITYNMGARDSCARPKGRQYQ